MCQFFLFWGEAPCIYLTGSCCVGRGPPAFARYAPVHRRRIRSGRGGISFRGAMFQRLTVLDLSGNELAVLPARFGDLKWLRVARLTRNHVVDLRPCVGLTGCEELDVSQNQIVDVPDTISGMKSLVTLDLARNAIKQIPAGVCKVRVGRIQWCFHAGTTWSHMRSCLV